MFCDLRTPDDDVVAAGANNVRPDAIASVPPSPLVPELAFHVNTALGRSQVFQRAIHWA
jgi:hypothetical protein